MADVPVRIHAPDETPREGRIIGVELRFYDPASGIQEEVALIPCDVRFPTRAVRSGWPPPQLEINATVHTTFGDTNFPSNAGIPGT